MIFKKLSDLLEWRRIDKEQDNLKSIWKDKRFEGVLTSSLGLPRIKPDWKKKNEDFAEQLGLKIEDWYYVDKILSDWLSGTTLNSIYKYEEYLKTVLRSKELWDGSTLYRGLELYDLKNIPKVGDEMVIKKTEWESWTDKKQSAKKFMGMDTGGKNLSVLLEYEPDPKEIVVDFRNLPKDSKYWHEREIILNRKKPAKYIDVLKTTQQSKFKKIGVERGIRKSFGSKTDWILDFYLNPMDDIDAQTRTELKSVLHLPFKSVYRRLNAMPDWVETRNLMNANIPTIWFIRYMGVKLKSFTVLPSGEIEYKYDSKKYIISFNSSDLTRVDFDMYGEDVESIIEGWSKKTGKSKIKFFINDILV